MTDCMDGLGAAFEARMTPERELRERERQLAKLQDEEWKGGFDYAETQWMHGYTREFEQAVEAMQLAISQLGRSER